jgi:hypothetical protein
MPTTIDVQNFPGNKLRRIQKHNGAGHFVRFTDAPQRMKLASIS